MYLIQCIWFSSWKVRRLNWAYYWLGPVYKPVSWKNFSSVLILSFHFLLMILKWNVLFSRCQNLKIDIKSCKNAVIEIDNIVTFVISAALHKPQRFYLLICSKHCKVNQCVQVRTVCIRFCNTHYLTLKPSLLFGYNGIAMHLENTSKWASTWFQLLFS